MVHKYDVLLQNNHLGVSLGIFWEAATKDVFILFLIIILFVFNNNIIRNIIKKIFILFLIIILFVPKISKNLLITIDHIRLRSHIAPIWVPYFFSHSFLYIEQLSISKAVLKSKIWYWWAHRTGYWLCILFIPPQLWRYAL
jgi:hypothetical protein